MGTFDPDKYFEAIESQGIINNKETDVIDNEDGTYDVTTKPGYIFEVELMPNKEKPTDAEIEYLGQAGKIKPIIKKIEVSATSTSITAKAKVTRLGNGTITYYYKLKSDPESSYKEITNVNEETGATQSTGITAGDEYIIKVVAKNDAGETEDTKEITATKIFAENITLNKTTETIEIGDTLTLIATVLPENATNKNVTWKSSDETIATVDENGVVTGKIVGNVTITVSTTDGSNKTAECKITVEMQKIEEADAFSRAIGVIDIVWLDTNNNVIDKPESPANYLAGLTPIKYNGTTETTVSNPTTDTSWYDYVAQKGISDGRTSKWANAKKKVGDNEAYFVWIPRYAYKITYFDTQGNANLYKTNNSKTGIIGYSIIDGLIDVKSGAEKLIAGTEPVNVADSVKTAGYTEYIPHPAFEFGGSKAGIWVGKYESSSSNPNIYVDQNTTSLDVRIVPNQTAWSKIQVSNIFVVSQKVKTTYGLTGDSHMMKNTEWGAVAYLTESKYGRNGTEIAKNTNKSYKTGGDYYTSNPQQSTTGNIYGIYDINGGSWEYVAGYLDNVSSNGYNTNLVSAASKYKDIYKVGTSEGHLDNYKANRGMKGDALFETSTEGTGSTSWHGDASLFTVSSSPVFHRGRLL